MNLKETEATLRIALDKFHLLDATYPEADLNRRCSEFLAIAMSPATFMKGYKHFTTDARSVVSNVCDEIGEGSDRVLLCGALLQAIVRATHSEELTELPPRVRTHQLKQLARIAATADPSSPWMTLDDDRFHKEFGLASMRLLAAAAQVLDLHSGVPRSTVLKRVFKSGNWHLVPAFMKLGGFRPFIEIHTHQGYLDDFNEDGWNECYHCCSEIYGKNPGILGMFGASWFYDPQIDNISPRLDYLSKTPLEGGAFRFLMAERGDFERDAISTSPTRRQLYESGQYRPKSYMLVWPRIQQRNWSNNNRSK